MEQEVGTTRTKTIQLYLYKVNLISRSAGLAPSLSEDTVVRRRVALVLLAF